MIPWRLKFSGVRDYVPTVMDFSGKDDHVLISGPNGAGKSTVTFCMGSVLYSSKVDLEGLKSNNLPSDHTWRAKIELLFKNDGQVKVDAPLFVQFRIDIEQKPGDPVKKEFYIQEGDTIDTWERETKYSSGDRNFNLTEYKKQLLYKYAVDPDAFYLIWYQKEVNQFAIMNPEERFRIFSEMNGIDKIQKNWEESKELVKDTEQTLQEAESKQKLNKFNLNRQKSELDRFDDRNKRLEEGFKQYYSALKWFQDFYQNNIQSIKKQIETLEGQQEENYEKKLGMLEEKDKQQEGLEQFQESIVLLEEEEKEISQELDALTAEINGYKDKLEEISKELEEIIKKIERIGMTEEEVKKALKDASDQYETVKDSVEKKEERNRKLANELVELNPKIAKLEVEIEQDQEKEKSVKELLGEYISSGAVQAEMDDNERKIENAKENKKDLQIKNEILEKELNNINKNRVYSPRQEVAIAYYTKNNIEVYPLRELIELDEAAKSNDEYLFDSIKYTLFVNKKDFIAPNDLYHVALPTIVPEKTVTRLPEKHIKIKDGLSDHMYPFGLKAMWWVCTFLNSANPRIENGILVDDKGMRGPQEEKRIILSDKVLQTQKRKIEEELESISKAYNELAQTIENLTKRNSILFVRKESLKDAEAFLTKENEREWRQKGFEKLCEKKDSLLQEQGQLQSELNGDYKLLALWEHEVSVYRKHQMVYAQYQQEKDKINKISQLKETIRRKEQIKKKHKNQLEEVNDEIDGKQRKEKQLKRELENCNEEIKDLDREIQQIERQIQDRKEEYLSDEESYAKSNQEFQRLIDTTNQKFNDYVVENEDIPKLTKPEAIEMQEKGSAQYYFALSEAGIDEAAPENYRIMKEEYDLSAGEVKKSKLLLEDYTERMERLKDELETTINMKIIGVHQKFVNYMSAFGFEGEIDWDMRVDSRNQIHYALYIRARKEGHRGKLEDVSIKARGGKVGKGVSGGEESLSSLLFALALLQTIKATPGYIVLDEFDSALDEGRKDKVFGLYEQELQRKMIILTPKSHEAEYLYRFSKAYVVYHNPNIPQSKILKITRIVEKDKV